MLREFRALAKQSAADVIGCHSFNQLITKAKRNLWTSLLAVLATCGVLQIPWEQRSELNPALWALLALATGSALNYCRLVRKLGRDGSIYWPNP